MQDLLTLARPYAKAAFEFAVTEQKIKEWQNFLYMAACAMKDPQTQAFRKNVHTLEIQLLQLLVGVLKNQADEATLRFLKLLAGHHRLELLLMISCLFHKYNLEYENKIDVDVYSVLPLTPEQTQKLCVKLENRLQRKIVLHEHADGSFVGGVVGGVFFFFIDFFWGGRLQRLTHVLVD